MHESPSFLPLELDTQYFTQRTYDVAFMNFGQNLVIKKELDFNMKNYFGAPIMSKIEYLAHALYFLGADYINTHDVSQKNYSSISYPIMVGKDLNLSKVIFVLLKSLAQLQIGTIEHISRQKPQTFTLTKSIVLPNKFVLPHYSYIFAIIELYLARLKGQNIAPPICSDLGLINPQAPECVAFLNSAISKSSNGLQPRLQELQDFTGGTTQKTSTDPLLPRPAGHTLWCCCFGCRH